MKFNKLVRDKIPRIIAENGGVAVTSMATAKEYRKLLRAKLQEEVSEFLKSEKVEELADILEVVYALGRLQKMSPQKLEKARLKKERERGGFKSKLLLIEVKERTK